MEQPGTPYTFSEAWAVKLKMVRAASVGDVGGGGAPVARKQVTAIVLIPPNPRGGPRVEPIVSQHLQVDS